MNNVYMMLSVGIIGISVIFLSVLQVIRHTENQLPRPNYVVIRNLEIELGFETAPLIDNYPRLKQYVAHVGGPAVNTRAADAILKEMYKKPIKDHHGTTYYN